MFFLHYFCKNYIFKEISIVAVFRPAPEFTVPENTGIPVSGIPGLEAPTAIYNPYIFIYVFSEKQHILK